MEDTHLNSMNILIGQPLFAVKFVLDYIQLEFVAPPPDGLALTLGVPPATMTSPYVEIEGMVFEWETAGYRDKLCACLGAIVREVLTAEGGKIILGLNNEASISAPLQPSKDSSNPSIVFHDGQHLWTW